MSQPGIFVGQTDHRDVLEGDFVFCQHQENQIVVQFRDISYLCKSHAKKVHEYLKKRIPGDKNVMVDLKGIVHVDAQGLALLIHLNKKLHGQNLELSIINPSSAVRRILGITKIDRLISIHADHEYEKAELESSEAPDILQDQYPLQNQSSVRDDFEPRRELLSEKKYK